MLPPLTVCPPPLPAAPFRCAGRSRLHQGPRHDNDHADIRLVGVAPTQGEVLCTESPFLPQNRYKQGAMLQ